jgi:enolase
MTDINEEAKTPIPTLDPTTSVLFDLGSRITTTRDNLNTAEQLLNQTKELSKERKLQHEDFQQFESLLTATKEFFDIATTDLMDELYGSLLEGDETFHVDL